MFNSYVQYLKKNTQLDGTISFHVYSTITSRKVTRYEKKIYSLQIEIDVKDRGRNKIVIKKKQKKKQD